MVSFGRKDPASARDEKGFGSEFPVKHYWRATESYTSVGNATFSDIVGGIDVTTPFGEAITDPATGINYINLCVQGTPNKTLQAPTSDSDSFVIIDGGAQTGPNNRVVIGDSSGDQNFNFIKFGDTTSGGIACLGFTYINVGENMIDSVDAVRFTVIDRVNQTLRIFVSSSDSDNIGDSNTLIYSADISSASGTLVGRTIDTFGKGAGNGYYEIGQCSSFIYAIFPKGTLPKDKQLFADFNELHPMIRANNKRLPAGWSPMY